MSAPNRELSPSLRTLHVPGTAMKPPSISYHKHYHQHRRTVQRRNRIISRPPHPHIFSTFKRQRKCISPSLRSPSPFLQAPPTLGASPGSPIRSKSARKSARKTASAPAPATPAQILSAVPSTPVIRRAATAALSTRQVTARAPLSRSIVTAGADSRLLLTALSVLVFEKEWRVLCVGYGDATGYRR